MRKITKIDKQIGEAITLHRSIRKMTKKELGEKMGSTYQQVYYYEKGMHQITINKLLKISKVLKVKFAKFLPSEIGGQYNSKKF